MRGVGRRDAVLAGSIFRLRGKTRAVLARKSFQDVGTFPGGPRGVASVIGLATGGPARAAYKSRHHRPAEVLFRNLIMLHLGTRPAIPSDAITSLPETKNITPACAEEAPFMAIICVMRAAKCPKYADFRLAMSRGGGGGGLK